MPQEIRWRILTLQIVGAVVLAVLAGIAFWGNNFTHDQVNQQLAAQKISMPNTSLSSAVRGLSQNDINALKPYSGEQMTNGDQAQAYANHYINVHLGEMGMTYSQVSAKYLAAEAANPNSAETKSLGTLRTTIFMGTMLRGSLLQAYAWWTVGTYALYAALALTFGAIVVFLAFLFELVVVPRREGIARRQPGRKAASPVV